MSYRAMLLAELQRRQQRNRRYSLRAFARDLGFSISFLSQILAERRHLSERSAKAVAEGLGWEPLQVREFTLSHRVETAPTPEARAAALVALRGLSPYGDAFSLVELDSFAVISKWYHLAILEWLRVNDFRGDVGALAERFGISPLEAELALERLFALGFLGRNSEGELRPQEPQYTVRELPAAVIRDFHATILRKALEALEGQSPGERDFSSTTLPLDPSLIPTARDRIRRFTAELTRFLESEGKERVVYQFSTQLFRLERPRR